MNVVTKVEQVIYPSPYFWDISLNPYATIENGLADCTCAVYGMVATAGLPIPVLKPTDARKWHERLTNGWVAIPYEEYKNNIKIGDIVEWVDGNHVAFVSNVNDGVWISGSFYTGLHGKAYWNGKYDTREGISSLQELNNYMLGKYQYRFFHYVPLETECSWCGGSPTYVLVSPNTITPVEKNNALNQVYVGVNGLRVRTDTNTNATITGVAPIGYYNVDKVVTGGDFEDGNTWYKIDKYYIAGVKGVIYYPKENLAPADEMLQLIKKMQEAYDMVVAENKDLKARLERIKELC